MLRVCTTSTGAQWSTLATLKAMLFGATATSTAEDDLLDVYLTRASEAVEDYLGYPLGRQVYEETLPGYGDQSLILARTPVQAIESLLDSTDLISSTGYTIEEPDAGLVRRDEGWPWTAAVQFELDPRPVVGSEWRRFTTVYEAGYVLTGSTSTDGWVTVTTGRTLPHWAEHATLEVAKSWYKRRAVDGSVLTKKVGDLSVSYGFTNQAQSMPRLPETALAILIRHARSV